jgi:hypothetical protein
MNNCCKHFKEIAHNFGWFRLEDGTKVMPFLPPRDNLGEIRVNYCPSCGKEIRNIQFKEDVSRESASGSTPETDPR